MKPRLFSGLFLLLLLGLASCKKAHETADKVTEEATGYRAWKQSRGAEEKVKEAERLELERARKAQEAARETN